MQVQEGAFLGLGNVSGVPQSLRPFAGSFCNLANLALRGSFAGAGVAMGMCCAWVNVLLHLLWSICCGRSDVVDRWSIGGRSVVGGRSVAVAIGEPVNNVESKKYDLVPKCPGGTANFDLLPPPYD